jgi:CAAX protease family protein
LLQWVALCSVAVATAATVAIWEGGKWRLGLFVPPREAVTELLLGVAGAAVLIGAADLLVLATTPLHHGRGSGLPWPELGTVFLPAVLHEELLFRGYVFQKLWIWHRRFAIVSVSGLFAALHLWNDDITVLAITNVFLGGILLSLAYERYRRLWFPIGLHLMWNLMSGAILGYEVSGYSPSHSVFTVVGTGPALLTGGAFGIEGSIWMTVAEGVAIVILLRMNVERRMQNEELRR